MGHLILSTHMDGKVSNLSGALGVILVVHLDSFGLLWSGRAKALVVIPILGSIWFAIWFGFHPILIQPPAIYQEDSPYQQVRVRDEKGLRFLVLDNTFHAIMWQPDPIRLALPYLSNYDGRAGPPPRSTDEV